MRNSWELAAGHLHNGSSSCNQDGDRHGGEGGEGAPGQEGERTLQRAAFTAIITSTQEVMWSVWFDPPLKNVIITGCNFFFFFFNTAPAWIS